MPDDVQINVGPSGVFSRRNTRTGSMIFLSRKWAEMGITQCVGSNSEKTCGSEDLRLGLSRKTRWIRKRCSRIGILSHP